MNKKIKVMLMTLGLFSFMLVAVILEVNVFNKDLKEEPNDNQKYINKTVFDNEIPVIKEETTKEVIIRPYLNEKVKVARNFYDYNEDDESQKNSIYYYGYTYMQNEGIDFSSDEMFEVVSILDGKVIEITNDEIYGNTIKIDHSNGIISTYQSLSQVNLKSNDVVKKGSVIGKSGTSRIDNDEKSYLHFELNINDTNVNPNLYFDKALKDI